MEYTFRTVSAVSAPASRFVPPPGRVLHMAGQSEPQFGDYVRLVTEDGRACPLPAGGAAYTSLTWDSFNPDSPDAKRECGEIPWLLARPWPLTLNLALWLGADQLVPIARGEFDAALARLGTGIAAARRPVYLRPGYEFDHPGHAFPPDAFKAAWRRIVEVVRAHAAGGAAFVWHSFAWRPTHEERDPIDWYPGDDLVDWIGVSIFTPAPKQLNARRLIEIARERSKPVTICECSGTRHGERAAFTGAALWDAWYAPLFAFIAEHPPVRAFSIINYDWDSSPGWKKLGWGDARLHADPELLRLWRERMRQPAFLHGEPDLYRLLGWEGESATSAWIAPSPGIG